MENLFNGIVETTAEYLKSNNIKTMVLGISGGIDSTVCAAVCYEINKRYGIDFIGISLHCNSNQDDERGSAMYCVAAFCPKFWCEDLESCFQFVKNTCSNRNGCNEVSQGNIKARLRMIYLYHVAAMNNGIVIDTDNYTENLLGFFTIHGDQGDYKPIGFLWKHEVYKLAKYLKEKYKDDEKKVHALNDAINITPTDGNGVKEGGDLAQIAPGYTYDDVDYILDRYINSRFYNSFRKTTMEEIDEKKSVVLADILDKYPKDIVMGIIERVENTRFKRRTTIPYPGVKWEKTISRL